MGAPNSYAELVQEKVENPLDFSRVLKMGMQNRGSDLMKSNVSHLYDPNPIFDHVIFCIYIHSHFHLSSFAVIAKTSFESSDS